MEFRLKPWAETGRLKLGLSEPATWKNSLGQIWLPKIMKLIRDELLDVTKILVLESDHSKYYSPQCNKFFKRLSGKAATDGSIKTEILT